MKTLSLTSPLTKNADVKALQAALAKNAYKAFYKDKVDGVYGTYTANAVKSAKFWLGYPASQIKGFAADPLYDYLTGKRQLPVTYKVRRNLRLKEAEKQAAEKTLGEKAFENAVKYLGVKESPANSNIVMFSKWYGLIGAWCAMFVTYNYQVGAGSKAFSKNASRWAYCPFMVSSARAGRDGLKEVSAANVRKGDVVLYDWDKDGVADHVGLFEGWTDKKKTKFRAIEGNTSPTDNSNGGEVMRRDRAKKDVIAYVRVMY